VRGGGGFSLAMPCPVRVFADADLEDASPFFIGITGAQCAWSAPGDVIESG